MAEPHHFAHWYPTAAYLYVLCLDTLALAWDCLLYTSDAADE